MIDPSLQEYIERMTEAAHKLTEKHSVLKILQSKEDSLWGKLYRNSEGKNIDERKSWTFTQEEWVVFSEGLAHAEVDYFHTLRLYQIAVKTYEAAYGTFKHDTEAIRKSHPYAPRKLDE